MGWNRTTVAAVLTVGVLFGGHGHGAAADGTTGATAWRDGTFNVDVPGLVSRSDIVLERPDAQPYQFMPLGNGNLGAAVWDADGLTAQLGVV